MKKLIIAFLMAFVMMVLANCTMNTSIRYDEKDNTYYLTKVNNALGIVTSTLYKCKEEAAKFVCEGK